MNDHLKQLQIKSVNVLHFTRQDLQLIYFLYIYVTHESKIK